MKSVIFKAGVSAAAVLAAAGAVAGEAMLGGNAVLERLSNVTKGGATADSVTFRSSAKAGVLDWSKFNVGAGQSVNFEGSKTTFFNLVSGAAGKSRIDGLIGGDGNVWVINPSGVAFGAGAVVNVGGVFAAAAGNVANADALRGGTATAPEFSAMTGPVEVGAAKFAADSVALMGRTVKISDGADFASAGSVAVGAARNLAVVEEIDGGKISLSVADFAEGLDDYGAVGGVAVGDAVVGGGFAAVSERNIDVAGALAAEGDVTLDAAAALTVAKGASVAAKGDAAFAAGAGAAFRGAIEVGGAARIAKSEIAPAPLAAKGPRRLAAASGAAETPSYDATIDGDLKMRNLSLDLSTEITGDANVEIADTLNVETAAGAKDLWLGVTGGAKLSAETINAKTLTVADAGEVAATTVNADAVVSGGSFAAKDGSLTVSGATTVSGGSVGGDAVALAGGLDQTGGSIKADALTLGGDASQTGGSLTANSLALDGAGDVDLSKGANSVGSVSGDAKSLALVNKHALSAGDLDIDGNLTLITKSGFVTIDGTIDAGRVVRITTADEFDDPDAGRKTDPDVWRTASVESYNRLASLEAVVADGFGSAKDIDFTFVDDGGEPSVALPSSGAAAND